MVASSSKIYVVGGGNVSDLFGPRPNANASDGDILHQHGPSNEQPQQCRIEANMTNHAI
jgi:hypothetical protein